MNRIKLFSVLVVCALCVFLLGGCSSPDNNPVSTVTESSAEPTATASPTKNPLPFSRRKSSKNDKILFYGFKWLEEFNAMKERFDQDFGADSYEITEGFYSIVDSPLVDTKDIGLQYRSFRFYGKNKEPLKWNVAGHELDHLELNCISGDNGENWYLVEGIYFFYQPSLKTNDDLMAKLKGLYSIKEERSLDHAFTARFTDQNANIVDYFFSYEYSGDDISGVSVKCSLQMNYRCKEIESMVWNKLYETEPVDTGDTTGL